MKTTAQFKLGVAAELPRPRPGALSPLLVGGSNLIGQAATAGLYIFAARELDPYLFGESMTALAVVLLTSDLTDMGQNAHQSRLPRTQRTTELWLSESFFPKMIITTLLGLALLVTILLGPYEVLWPFLLVLIGQTAAQALLVPLRREGALKLLVAVTASERAISLLAFLTMYMPYQGAKLAVSLAIGEASVIVLCLFYMREAIRAFRFRSLRWAAYLQGWRIGAANLLTDSTQLNTALIGIVAGPVTAGLISAAQRLTSGVAGFVYAGCQYLLPHTPPRTRIASATNIRRFAPVLLPATFASFFFIFFGPWLIRLLYGPAFESASQVVRILGLGVVFSAISQITGVLLMASSFDRWLLGQHLITSILATTIIGCASANYGLTGAAWATASTTILIGCAGIVSYQLAGRNDSDIPSLLHSESPDAPGTPQNRSNS